MQRGYRRVVCSVLIIYRTKTSRKSTLVKYHRECKLLVVGCFSDGKRFINFTLKKNHNSTLQMNQPLIQEPGGGPIERYVPPEPFCAVFVKRSFLILSTQFERVDATHWTLNLSQFVGHGYADIKECCLCVNGANGT